MLIILTALLSATDFKYYTYDNSIKIPTGNMWEGSEMGDYFGYSHGPSTIQEHSWNNSKSVTELDYYKYSKYDVFITVLEGRIYAGEKLLIRHDSLWIPAGTYVNIWLTSKEGRMRSVYTGITQDETDIVTNNRIDNYIIHDEHAECSKEKCAVDIINENKTEYDPYILSVYFLEDSTISLHEHPCGAVYYILEGMMCYTQSNDQTVCLNKGESYWTSPSNKYTENAKKYSKILVLGFQCPPIFSDESFMV